MRREVNATTVEAALGQSFVEPLLHDRRVVALMLPVEEAFIPGVLVPLMRTIVGSFHAYVYPEWYWAGELGSGCIDLYDPDLPPCGV